MCYNFGSAGDLILSEFHKSHLASTKKALQPFEETRLPLYVFKVVSCTLHKEPVTDDQNLKGQFKYICHVY